MKRRLLFINVGAGVLALSLAACNGINANADGAISATPLAATPTARATATAVNPTAAPAINLARNVTGVGEVKAARDATLVFTVPGTVAEVLVQEGGTVTTTQVLARLNLRRFDREVQQAEAALAAAEAEKLALEEPPRNADVNAAQAQIAASKAALAQLQAGAKQQDVQTAQAQLEASRAQEQTTRDQLSRTKTTAEAGIEQAAQALVQAQAAYAKAKSDWEFVQDTGNDPQAPEIPSATGMIDNEVVNSQRETYYAAFVQAEAALRQAEQAVEQAQVDAQVARQAEVEGIRAAEQQVTQAQAALERVQLPADSDQVAAAQAGIAAAQAEYARLFQEPSAAQQAVANAGIAQAQAAVEITRLNREDAQLRAPFDGVVTQVNVDPGDPGMGGEPAIVLVDTSNLHIDVDISDVDITRVRLDQPAQVYVEGVAGRTLTGRVSYIAPAATIQGSIRTYLVRVILDEADGLRPGMSARVELLER
jgi:HlyD family secretion protein